MDYIKGFVENIYESLGRFLSAFVVALISIATHPIVYPLVLNRRWRAGRAEVGPVMFLFVGMIIFFFYAVRSGLSPGIIKDLVENSKPGREIVVVVTTAFLLTVAFAFLIYAIQTLAFSVAAIVRLGPLSLFVQGSRRPLKRRRWPQLSPELRRMLWSRSRCSAALYAASFTLLLITLIGVTVENVPLINLYLSYVYSLVGPYDFDIFEIYFPFSTFSIPITLAFLILIVTLLPLLTLPFYALSVLSTSYWSVFKKGKRINFLKFLATSFAMYCMLFAILVPASDMFSWLISEEPKDLKVTSFLCTLRQDGQMDAYVVVDNRSKSDLLIGREDLALELMHEINDEATGWTRPASMYLSNGDDDPSLLVVPSGEKGWFAARTTQPFPADEWSSLVRNGIAGVYCSVTPKDSFEIVKASLAERTAKFSNLFFDSRGAVAVLPASSN